MTGQTARLLIATNASGVGIDAPTIRAVIHVRVCLQMKQYSQESSRARRDGKGSEAIMLPAE